MTALLVVRAEVPEADRAAFDRWYETEHLPDALAAFSARAAWRGWSEESPGVHLAWYEFETLERARGGPAAVSVAAPGRAAAPPPRQGRATAPFRRPAPPRGRGAPDVPAFAGGGLRGGGGRESRRLAEDDSLMPRPA